MSIKSLDEIRVHSLKTSCGFTGSILDETQEEKILHLKEKLLEKAIRQYSTITPCGTQCFQVQEKELLFWFNFNETTKIITENIDTEDITF
jgi:hypothetical protein